MIEQIDPAVTEMYLSHAEPGMKRAYAERDWARLDRAMKKMGKRLEDMLAMTAAEPARASYLALSHSAGNKLPALRTASYPSG